MVVIDSCVDPVDSLEDINVASHHIDEQLNGLKNNNNWCWSVLLTSWLYVLVISGNS